LVEWNSFLNMKKPAFLILVKKYLSHAINVEDLERDFLVLRRAQAKSGQYDFDLSDPSIGWGYDLIFSLIDRLYIGDNPGDLDISESDFRVKVSKIIDKIDRKIPQNIPFRDFSGDS